MRAVGQHHGEPEHVAGWGTSAHSLGCSGSYKMNRSCAGATEQPLASKDDL